MSLYNNTSISIDYSMCGERMESTISKSKIVTNMEAIKNIMTDIHNGDSTIIKRLVTIPIINPLIFSKVVGVVSIFLSNHRPNA